ncbi:nucleoside hydrolase [Nocardia sp. NPDC004568]|uniref:nucleoside hydrolase n=1 Tax=Nocardia sp. NPDC004568 TaxID=3154551 RepID=UPI0033BE42E0
MTVCPRNRRQVSSDASSPIILDTDIGGDPDDAVMVTCAARVPELAAVLTADEVGGERARFARHQLDLLGRTEVPVTAGADLGNTKYWVVDGMTPETVPGATADVVGTVRTVCATTSGPVRWIGCGPLTNLASVLRAAPELADRLIITQMGGALHHPDPRGRGRAEHNFRLDPDAARYILTRARHLTLVLADVTFTDTIALYPGHPLYQQLGAPGAPPWAALLVEHIDRWDTDFGYTTKMHDPLTLSVALGLGFVTVDPRPIIVGDDGRASIDHDRGSPVRVSTGADYSAFMNWLSRQLIDRRP